MKINSRYAYITDGDKIIQITVSVPDKNQDLTIECKDNTEAFTSALELLVEELRKLE